MNKKVIIIIVIIAVIVVIYYFSKQQSSTVATDPTLPVVSPIIDSPLPGSVPIDNTQVNQIIRPSSPVTDPIANTITGSRSNPVVDTRVNNDIPSNQQAVVPPIVIPANVVTNTRSNPVPSTRANTSVNNRTDVKPLLTVPSNQRQPSKTFIAPPTDIKLKPLI